MWANRVQIDGKEGPGQAMPVLLPLLLMAVLFVAGMYGGTLNETVDGWERQARVTLGQQ